MTWQRRTCRLFVSFATINNVWFDIIIKNLIIHLRRDTIPAVDEEHFFYINEYATFSTLYESSLRWCLHLFLRYVLFENTWVRTSENNIYIQWFTAPQIKFTYYTMEKHKHPCILSASPDSTYDEYCGRKKTRGSQSEDGAERRQLSFSQAGCGEGQRLAGRVIRWGEATHPPGEARQRSTG